jgi:hypothetical protein
MRGNLPPKHLICLAPRAGLPRASNINGLASQPALRGLFDPQRLSGVVANHSPPPLGRQSVLPTAQSASAPFPSQTTRRTGVCFTHIPEANQLFAHIENKSAEMESAMTFKQGVSGNPHGNRHHSRHLLNQEFIQALLLHFREHGKKAIEKVAREQPAAYMKILALLVPREMKIEHIDRVKGLSDEQLEAMISHLEERIARRTDQAII